MKTKFSINDLPLADSANRAIEELKRLAHISDLSLTGAGLLYERAYLMATSPATYLFSSCKLLKCKDGVLAVNLPRESDWEMIPAWLGPWCNEVTVAQEDWDTLEQFCQSIEAGDLIDQANILGLAVSLADQLSPAPNDIWHTKPVAPKLEIRKTPDAAPLVVDLSSLWAGPLCSHLLSMAGCRVIKVESSDRLDGARSGLPTFYQLLNQGKESLTLNFKDPAHICLLKQLLSEADIIIEGSRPRALQNLGIDAEDLLSTGRGQVWISITGFGRYGPSGSKVGFGDDAGAAAGLCQVMYQATGEYALVGDAIADPITGIHAALAAWQGYHAGGNALISLALKDTVSYCLHRELSLNPDRVHQSCRLWMEYKDQLKVGFPHGARTICNATAKAGEHNDAILRALKLAQPAPSGATSSTAP